MKKLSEETNTALLRTKFPHNPHMFTVQVRKELEDNLIIKNQGFDVVLTETGEEYLKSLPSPPTIKERNHYIAKNEAKKSENDEVAGLKKHIEDYKELSKLKELRIKELESSLLNIDEENTMLLSRINDLTRLSENMANDLIQQSEFIQGSFESLAAYKNFTQTKKNVAI